MQIRNPNKSAMKKIIFIFVALIFYGSASAAGITSITGSSTPCPTASTTYTATYAFALSPSYGEVITSVVWEFIQNGKVIYKKVTGGASGLGSGISQVILSPTSIGGEITALPTGKTEIKITMFYTAFFSFGPPLQLVTIKTRDIFIGIPAAESISGNNICPNTSGIFTIPTLANSNSYTWEVPTGWKVNGVTGPVVTGQGTTVSITPCPFITTGLPQGCETTFYNEYTIKVRGSSPTCGVSDYTTKKITIDYPVRITETNLPNNNVKLTSTPNNLPSYQWTLDPAWNFPVSGNKNLPEINFNSSGITGLATLTYKTPCQNTYIRNWWWVKPAQPGDPGWTGDPVDPNPGDCEPGVEMNQNYSAKSGYVIYLKDPCNEIPPVASIFANGVMKRVTLTKSFDGYEYNMSELKPGSYILRVKSTSGKYKTVKFIKLD